MKKGGFTIRKLCIFVGAGVLAVAFILLAIWQWNIKASREQSQKYVQLLGTLMPEPQAAVPEERRDNTMSVLSVEGTDFVGILEMPRYGSSLPICADWGATSKYPCRFYGSIYDGTLQIGATSQQGQYDFYRKISVGDRVFFTDMEGNRYALEVTDLRYEKEADQTTLHRENAVMTLFIKNLYAFEYLVVYCDVVS